jgi:hypothetical protein
MSHYYCVFYLIGGSTNFVCNKIQGRFNDKQSQIEVAELERMGYKAMAVKSGDVVGGYSSFTDFDSTEDAVKYYRSL